MRSVRVFFKKTGNMKFISHLDMNRFMIRMVRMSKIPVWYSEGFNPHPYITFALPLSLGFESSYEIMDIRLDKDEYPNKSVFEALKKLMPEGIEIFDCKDPVMKAGEVAYADFEIDFGTQISEITPIFETFLSSDTITAEKKTKKGGYKTIDLKGFIKSYKIGENTISLTLAAGGSNNLNPKLLLDTFVNKSSVKLPPYTITRSMLYNDKMECFK